MGGGVGVGMVGMGMGMGVDNRIGIVTYDIVLWWL